MSGRTKKGAKTYNKGRAQNLKPAERFAAAYVAQLMYPDESPGIPLPDGYAKETLMMKAELAYMIDSGASGICALELHPELVNTTGWLKEHVNIATTGTAFSYSDNDNPIKTALQNHHLVRVCAAKFKSTPILDADAQAGTHAIKFNQGAFSETTYNNLFSGTTSKGRRKLAEPLAAIWTPLDNEVEEFKETSGDQVEKGTITYAAAGPANTFYMVEAVVWYEVVPNDYSGYTGKPHDEPKGSLQATRDATQELARSDKLIRPSNERSGMKSFIFDTLDVVDRGLDTGRKIMKFITPK